MCVQIRRQYRVETLDPRRVADFVAAALMSVLSPADWQITADVEDVAARYTQALVERVHDGIAEVEVVAHAQPTRAHE